ncbi:MAG TPA: hypothetical protein VKC57_15020 [Ktedonobacterales bacterium]|nr:hypothetical protein [Ktedonobacterales bacterium]
MTAPTMDDVLQTIQEWPSDARLALAYRILQSVVEPAPRTVTPKHTLDHALGLLARDTPPPDDAQVQQWLDEHREEKYG